MTGPCIGAYLGGAYFNPNPHKTSKSQFLSIISYLMIFAGIGFFLANHVNGVILVVLGLVLKVVAKGLSWWNHG